MNSGAAMLFSRNDKNESAPASAPVPSAEPAKVPQVGKGRPRKGEIRLLSGRPKRCTSVVFDAEQYDKVCEIGFNERLSIRETLFLLLQEGISKYERTGKLGK